MKKNNTLLGFCFLVLATLPNFTCGGHRTVAKPEPPIQSAQTTPTSPEVIGSDPFAKVDQHVRACPKSAARNVTSLAAYLAAGCQTPWEKTRAIFVWLAENIQYDDHGYNTGSYIHKDYDAETVLDRKTAVCEGYSNLFLALADEMGLEAKKVSGYAKGYSHYRGQKFQQTNHAWNLVRLDDKWHIFDATWGSGFGSTYNDRMVSKKQFDPYWFDVDPYAAIFDHLPEKAEYQLIDTPIDLKTFAKWPDISDSFFKLGFSPKDIFQKVSENPAHEFPVSYTCPATVRIIKAPDVLRLQRGKTYVFEIEAPVGQAMALICQRDWQELPKKEGVYKINYTPKVKGKCSLGLKVKATDKTFHSFLSYQVE